MDWDAVLNTSNCSEPSSLAQAIALRDKSDQHMEPRLQCLKSFFRGGGGGGGGVGGEIQSIIKQEHCGKPSAVTSLLTLCRSQVRLHY